MESNFIPVMEIKEEMMDVSVFRPLFKCTFCSFETIFDYRLSKHEATAHAVELLSLSVTSGSAEEHEPEVPWRINLPRSLVIPKIEGSEAEPGPVQTEEEKAEGTGRTRGSPRKNQKYQDFVTDFTVFDKEWDNNIRRAHYGGRARRRVRFKVIDPPCRGESSSFRKECGKQKQYGRRRRKPVSEPDTSVSRVFKCNLCTYRTESSTTRKSHQTMHKVVKKFKCKLCPFWSNYATVVLRHQLRNHDILLQPTDSERKRIESPVGRVSQGSDPQKELSSKKPACRGLKPQTHVNCQQPQGRVRKLQISRSTKPLKVYSCSICDYKTTNTNSYSIQTHQKRHSTVDLYKCSLCPYWSHDPVVVSIHKKGCHGITPANETAEGAQMSLQVPRSTSPGGTSSKLTPQKGNGRGSVPKTTNLSQPQSCSVVTHKRGRKPLPYPPQQRIIEGSQAKGGATDNLSRSSPLSPNSTAVRVSQATDRKRRQHVLKFCDICDYSTPYSMVMWKHKQGHQLEKKFKCSICPYWGDARWMIWKHLKQCHRAVQKVTVGVTHYSPTLEGKATVHARARTVNCPLCTWSGAVGLDLNIHLEQFHKIHKIDPNAEPKGDAIKETQAQCSIVSSTNTDEGLLPAREGCSFNTDSAAAAALLLIRHGNGDDSFGSEGSPLENGSQNQPLVDSLLEINNRLMFSESCSLAPESRGEELGELSPASEYDGTFELEGVETNSKTSSLSSHLVLSELPTELNRILTKPPHPLHLQAGAWGPNTEFQSTQALGIDRQLINLIAAQIKQEIISEAELNEDEPEETEEEENKSRSVITVPDSQLRTSAAEIQPEANIIAAEAASRIVSNSTAGTIQTSLHLATTGTPPSDVFHNKCISCMKSFIWESNWKRHQKLHKRLIVTHSAPESLKSSLKNCSRRKRRKECKICGFKSLQDSAVLRHVMSHSKLESYMCKDCGKSFGFYGTLLRHRKHRVTCCSQSQSKFQGNNNAQQDRHTSSALTNDNREEEGFVNLLQQHGTAQSMNPTRGLINQSTEPGTKDYLAYKGCSYLVGRTINSYRKPCTRGQAKLLGSAEPVISAPPSEFHNSLVKPVLLKEIRVVLTSVSNSDISRSKGEKSIKSPTTGPKETRVVLTRVSDSDISISKGEKSIKSPTTGPKEVRVVLTRVSKSDMIQSTGGKTRKSSSKALKEVRVVLEKLDVPHFFKSTERKLAVNGNKNAAHLIKVRRFKSLPNYKKQLAIAPRVLKCSRCHYDTLFSPAIRVHLKSHFRNKQFSCKDCLFDCEDLREYNQHMKCIHNYELYVL